MVETILGIDLGTTNSEVAITQDGQSVVIGDRESRIVPSVVGIADDGGILVGHAAKNQYTLYPERTVKSIKRQMGSDTTLDLSGHQYTPQEISAIILKHLKQVAEGHLGHSVTKAVITVPAYFNDAQRQATRDAGQIAGLDVVRIINEPTAAALAYEIGHKRKQNVLVYDLGGGTFDVSVVRMEDDVVEVVSSHGNNFLGGDDFDQCIIDVVVKHLNHESDYDVQTSAKAMARIRSAVEEAKKQLSDEPFVKIQEQYLYEDQGQPVHLDMELSRGEYEGLISHYVEETLEAVHTALKGAQMTVSDIDQVLLVGGATRTPLVRRRLEEEFEQQPRGEVDPDLCVAIGASLQAAIIGGQDVSSVLVDITPYTFGTSAVGEVDGMPTDDMFVAILHKNTPIPVMKSEVFHTMVHGQEVVDVRIFQGEDRRASNNVEIGSFRIEDLGDVEAGNPILLQLSLDLNGVLEVTAKEKNTGLQKTVSIDNAMQRFEQADMEKAKQRVDEMFDVNHDEEVSRDDKTEQQAHVQAKALIEKAERMLDDATAEDQEDIINIVEDVRDAMSNQDQNKLTTAMAELADIVYYLES